MAQTALAPTRVKAVGSFTELLMGVAGGSGTSTTVTLPAHLKVRAVLVGGATSATAPFCDTISDNTFTVTHASNDLFVYHALVQGRI